MFKSKMVQMRMFNSWNALRDRIGTPEHCLLNVMPPIHCPKNKKSKTMGDPANHVGWRALEYPFVQFVFICGCCSGSRTEAQST